jgi:hypothetical protein
MVYPTLPGFPQCDENHESTPLKRGERLCIVFCIDAHIFPEIEKKLPKIDDTLEVVIFESIIIKYY